MKIPTVQGIIRRRLLVNFRADPEVATKLLPGPFRPKLHCGFAIIGLCLIRLEQIRPKAIPTFFGLSSENAAHRFAVEWSGKDGSRREGVFIPRRDTSSYINSVAGGRVFPGEHHRSEFRVTDIAGRIDFSMKAFDRSSDIKLRAVETDSMPKHSCFQNLGDASSFFEGGSLGYSVTKKGIRLDGLNLKTLEWRVKPLNVIEISSSYFDDPNRFPKGTIEFDHALIMRDLKHEWHQADDLFTEPQSAFA